MKIHFDLNIKKILPIVGVIILLAGFGGLYYWQYTKTTRNNKLYIDQKAQSAALSTELDTIKESLSKTEEGKKQLESLKGELEKNQADLQNQNSQLETKATTAEKDAADKKAALDKATADLNTQKAALAKVQTDLNAKQSELEKAKRGVALFDGLQGSFDQYNVHLSQSIEYIVNAMNNAVSGADPSIIDRDLDLAIAELNQADVYYNQINNTLAKLKAGNY